jgi:hypothetical protein
MSPDVEVLDAGVGVGVDVVIMDGFGGGVALGWSITVCFSDADLRESVFRHR